ncbi:hypothetical protein [Bacillus phage 1_ICo-2020]|uniref:DUF6440 domain-containing protein n=1 Tax=Bacillus phage 1_ICo-2020 TaxID=2759272 RepID=A0A7G8AKG6_9CAUD|nr:hypothetical protein [Bacillus phage 1_ICo-2020]
MRKTIVVLAVVLVLIGCSSGTKTGASLGRLENIGKDGNIILFKDNKTGCQYMRVSAGYGQVIEPVLNREGKPYCE